VRFGVCGAQQQRLPSFERTLCNCRRRSCGHATCCHTRPARETRSSCFLVLPEHDSLRHGAACACLQSSSPHRPPAACSDTRPVYGSLSAVRLLLAFQLAMVLQVHRSCSPLGIDLFLNFDRDDPSSQAARAGDPTLRIPAWRQDASAAGTASSSARSSRGGTSNTLNPPPR